MESGLAKLFPDTAQTTAEGHLVIGGCDVVGLAKQFDTPLYIFDEETLRSRCRAFVREFSQAYRGPVTVLYASKAFLNPALARLFQEEGLGLDVVSGGEMAVARAVGFPPERVHFHGNNKSARELEDALEWGVGRVVVDGFRELELVEEMAHRQGRVQEVLLRLSPGVDPHTHAHTTTGVLDSKFGFPLETGQAAEAVRAALRCGHLRLLGLHCHLGSPIFELEPYRVATEAIVSFAASLREEGLEMEEFSPGGGFAIAYTRQDQPPTIAHYAQAIASSLAAACHARGLPLPRLVVEPGRAIVGPAGVALYRVGSVKEILGVRTYVAVDGGMGDNIRPALYGAVYEAVVANRMGAAPDLRVTVAGKYCESGDILVRDLFLPRPLPGDLIAMPAAGAYAPSMASVYNLNPRPAIVMVREGQAHLIRRRESYQDLMYLDIF